MNFTQETEKFLKSLEDGIKLKFQFEVSMIKPSSRQSTWIYGRHNLELGRGSYEGLKMLPSIKPEVLVLQTGDSGFRGSESNLGWDFHRI